jgi:arginyl-tRNA synthetase
MADSDNLFDLFDRVATGDGERPLWAARAPYQPHERYDLMLVPRVKGWQEDPAAIEALERLEREPCVEVIDRDDKQVWVRLADNWVEGTGKALVTGGNGNAPHADLAAGRTFALNFWDANSTKALHIGHLRNLALGNALGAALTEAGGRVERRSIICDVGRSMGEAMAGVVASGRHDSSLPENGQKSDHFVGACYAEYVKSGPSLTGRERDDNPASSLSREVDVHHDSADELLQRVLDGDQEAIELWSRTRAWVISGQRKTLARLGISFDRVFFESDFLPEVVELSNLGLEHGMLQRRPDGAVIYLTDREELEEMPLLRADGLPTQHMRALAYWMAAPGLEGTTSIQVCGLEWVAHVTCRRQLMDRMMEKGAGADINHPAHDVFHGMVSKQSESVSSSKKNALLIDELAEWIDAALDEEEERVGVRERHPLAEAIVPQVALGYFLMHTNTKPLDFEPEKLLRAEQSLGWDLARARAHNGNGSGAAAAEPASDPDYRFAVVQSEMYRRHLMQAVERLDVSPLAKYVAHLSRWYLEDDREPHVQAATQAALAQGARGLGLEVVR